jgi:hypothetical protein
MRDVDAARDGEFHGGLESSGVRALCRQCPTCAAQGRVRRDGMAAGELAAGVVYDTGDVVRAADGGVVRLWMEAWRDS